MVYSKKENIFYFPLKYPISVRIRKHELPKSDNNNNNNNIYIGKLL